jgi:hypothetical protein
MVVERPMENKVSPKIKNLYVVWIKNIFPTWDRMYKRQIEGPGRCPLCRSDVESIFHLLVQWQFTDKIWKEASSTVHIACVWVGNLMEDAWKS